MFTVRAEIAEDIPVIRQVNELGFGQPCEADLVDALRAAVLPYISLVAVSEGGVVGHIFFSPVTLESEDSAFILTSVRHKERELQSAIRCRRPRQQTSRVRSSPDGHSTAVLRHRRLLPVF